MRGGITANFSFEGRQATAVIGRLEEEGYEGTREERGEGGL